MMYICSPLEIADFFIVIASVAQLARAADL